MFKRLLLLVLLILSVSSLHAQTVAYVTNNLDNTVSVIDTSTNTVIAVIPVGSSPQGVTLSADGTRAYVANGGGGTISVIDTASNSVIATIALPSGSFPAFLAVTPDGKSLYVPDSANGDVLVVSTATNTVTATIPISSSTTGAVAITPDGARAYVLSTNAVSVIDTASNTVLGSPIPVSADLSNILYPGIAITSAGNTVFVAGGLDDVVSEISTATNTVSATVGLSVFSHPAGLAITPDGSKVYVSKLGTSVVSVIDTASNTLEPSSISVGGPVGMAVTPDGAFAYVTNSGFFRGNNTVLVISTATNTVVATVGVGSGPLDIAIGNVSSPFAAFTMTIDNLVINNNLHEQGDFTLGANTGGVDLAHQPVTLTVNNFSLTIPAGSFHQVGGNMHFVFNGTVNGFAVNFNLQAVNGTTTQFTYEVDVHGVNITGPDPATVGLKIGHNSGTTMAEF